MYVCMYVESPFRPASLFHVRVVDVCSRDEYEVSLIHISTQRTEGVQDTYAVSRVSQEDLFRSARK